MGFFIKGFFGTQFAGTVPYKAVSRGGDSRILRPYPYCLRPFSVLEHVGHFLVGVIEILKVQGVLKS